MCSNTFTKALVILLSTLSLGITFAETTRIDVLPSQADPTVTGWNEPHVVIFPSSPPLVGLYVHLPGSFASPRSYEMILNLAAEFGYAAVGLSYPNSWTVASLCSSSEDQNCTEKVRREIVMGTDSSPLIDIPSQDSILKRLSSLISWMSENYPGEGWDGFLEQDGSLWWWRIAVGGHSQGAGHAAFIAKEFLVSAVALFSGPVDNYDGCPAPWLAYPSTTPINRWTAFSHSNDPFASLISAALNKLGLESPATNEYAAEELCWPFLCAQVFTTQLPSEHPHGSTVADPYTPVDSSSGEPIYGKLWLYMISGRGPAWIVPAVGRIHGAEGTFWTTRVDIGNPKDQALTLKAELVGPEGGTVDRCALQVSSMESLALEDAWLFFGGVGEGIGTLYLWGPQLPIAAVCSTPASGGSGSFGQLLPVASCRSLETPATVMLCGASYSISGVVENSRWRTNLLLSSISDCEAQVEVKLICPEAREPVVGHVDLSSHETMVVSRVVRWLGVTHDVENCLLILKASPMQAAVMAFASRVDAQTGDAAVLLPLEVR